eukprot:COSAG05_NODE_1929_length_3819_cov_16.551882_1_plen_58_part_10
MYLNGEPLGLKVVAGIVGPVRWAVKLAGEDRLCVKAEEADDTVRINDSMHSIHPIHRE